MPTWPILQHQFRSKDWDHPGPQVGNNIETKMNPYCDDQTVVVEMMPKKLEEALMEIQMQFSFRRQKSFTYFCLNLREDFIELK